MRDLQNCETSTISGGFTEYYEYDEYGEVVMKFHTEGGWGFEEASGPSAGAQPFASAVGAVTGAALCTGAAIPSAGATVPLVPYCAATGAFVGAIVANLDSSGAGTRADSLPMVP